ncbi:response regulator [Tichowtungia aerotolerans]|uniref:Response regulator n=1 Tax=Tichowtungia aerotolerans TaxID=2697043 RepID=A0A6P1M6W3_9BACT|nr:response regulator transcription factor [Tichowtungia aerotolerans]QHI69591.1 response regulator [Tichowtungia aerotolerans]
MKILLIEDDARTAAFIIKGLQQEGFSVDHATDGEVGLHMAQETAVDAAIIDIMLPKLNGLSLIGQIRQKNINVPIIALSALSSIEDRVKGLHVGADDYLMKPFAFSELLARIQALLRRSTAQAEPTTLTVGDLQLDIVRRKVFRNGREIELQPREFSLLEYLMRNSGRVISKTMIMEHVWDYNFDPQTNVVEARMCRLRDKVDRDFERKLIKTIRGMGYVLE